MNKIYIYTINTKFKFKLIVIVFFLASAKGRGRWVCPTGFPSGLAYPRGGPGGEGGSRDPPRGGTPRKHTPPIFGGWGGDAPPCHVGALAIFSRFLQKSIY